MIRPLLSCGSPWCARLAVGVLHVGEVVLDQFVADVVGACASPCVAAAVLAEEREVHAARHVRRGHERADEADDEEQR